MRNIKEDFIVQLQHDFLMILRKQQQEQDGHASDDEVSRSHQQWS